MFIGHFGLAMAAKKVNSKPSLAIFFLAAQFLDLLWPLLLVLHIEKVAIEPGDTAFTPLHFISYPYSHSLLFAVIWSFLFAMIYGSLRKNWRSATLLGLLVFSHWVLDVLTHRPDLQLSPWSEKKFGLGLW